MPTIDAHHHFWHYTPEDYGWIDDTMGVLREDFLSPDLRRETRAAGVDGVVTVQARQKLAETTWLLDLADKHEFIRGVVGWVPLADRRAGKCLEEFAVNKKFRGVRHVLQDEADDHYMLRDDFNRGVEKLRKLSLVYDILIFERHLPQTIQFVDRHPAQVFVLDHLAKPRVKDQLIEPWAKNLRELAKRPNVYCKISGLAVEADWKKWTDAQLKIYFDVALEAFGPRRLMFGSDWPVCLLATGYGRWHALVKEWVRPLSDGEQQRILGGTAIEAYRLL